MAKTALPSQGRAIIGIDVSRDGRYIVATTKTQLIFIDAEIKDGNYKGQVGCAYRSFRYLTDLPEPRTVDRSFAAGSKPQGHALRLTPQHEAHIASVAGEISFTPAKFNMGLDDIERTIVTSTGPYAIAWNFRKVKAGDYTSYVITRCVYVALTSLLLYPSHAQDGRCRRGRWLPLWWRPRHCALLLARLASRLN